jgi:hypothetical protein
LESILGLLKSLKIRALSLHVTPLTYFFCGVSQNRYLCNPGIVGTVLLASVGFSLLIGFQHFNLNNDKLNGKQR